MSSTSLTAMSFPSVPFQPAIQTASCLQLPSPPPHLPPFSYPAPLPLLQEHLVAGLSVLELMVLVAFKRVAGRAAGGAVNFEMVRRGGVEGGPGARLGI